MNVWGDPHLTASNGNVAEFQTNGLAIKLADGTIVEFQPTALSHDVAHVSEVAVTNSGGTVLMSNFEGQAGSAVVVSAVHQGNAHAADSSMGNINDTVLTAGTQDIGALKTFSGATLASTNPAFDLDGLGGGVNQYDTNFVVPVTLALPARIGGASSANMAGNSEQNVQPATASVGAAPAIASATTQPATATPALASLPDVAAVIRDLSSQVIASPNLTSGQAAAALASLNSIQTELLGASATAPAPASANPSTGISRFTIDNILREADGLAPLAAPDTSAAIPTTSASVAPSVPGMITQLLELVSNSTLSPGGKDAAVTTLASIGNELTALPIPMPEPAILRPSPASTTVQKESPAASANGSVPVPATHPAATQSTGVPA